MLNRSGTDLSYWGRGPSLLSNQSLGHFERVLFCNCEAILELHLFLDMLAPRKKLWSTPLEVINKAIEVLEISGEDTVIDIGAGDGRFLLQCAESSPACRIVGYEIDEERGKIAQNAIAEKGYAPGYVDLVIGNALEQDYNHGTIFFLYLVPRGLRLILPLLKSIPHHIKVVTYMSPLPESEKPLQHIKVGTANHKGAEWPLWLYSLNEGVPGDQQTETEETKEKGATDTDANPLADYCAIQ